MGALAAPLLVISVQFQVESTKLRRYLHFCANEVLSYWTIKNERNRNMDNAKIGGYIQMLRRRAGLTQKDLAERLNISFQAVSKWETGESLPDTGLLLELSDILGVSVDKLLTGGAFITNERKLMRLEDVKIGFELIEDIGRCFGEKCTFYTAMIDGINEKMNMDILEYLSVPETRDVMYAEVLIQGIMDGKTVDMEEIESGFGNKHMVEVIRDYLKKTDA